jgi:hypothetical protein
MSTEKETIQALGELFLTQTENTYNGGIPGNVTDALFAIAEGLQNVAGAIRKLGTADASTDQGALEVVAEEIRNGFEKLSGATGAPDMSGIASTIHHSFERLALEASSGLAGVANAIERQKAEEEQET